MLKRRNFARYNTIENVVPPLNTPTPTAAYPQFIPEISSFQTDNFLRDANSYSTIDYQMFTNSISYTPNQYRKAIYQGIDLFQDFSEDFDWVELQEDEELIDLMRPFKRTYTDYYGYNEADGELDTFILNYTPYRVWSELTRCLGSVYYYIMGEQLNTAIFTYYYFYYYFLFTEYILEHVSLYFPGIKSVSEYQLFSTFEGAYFNFYEIVLGCYLPVIFIFYFSQYNFFKAAYANRSYFVFGHSCLFYFFSILPVYLLTGYSIFVVFFTFCIFFCIFSAFYIFEIYPSFYESSEFRRYSSYFLPVSKIRNQLYLPVFHFYFKAWPRNIATESPFLRKQFTRYPFTQNVRKLAAHYVRFRVLHLREITYSTALKFVAPPSMPMMGLLFPKNSNLNAYSFKAHKSHVINYPAKDFMPFSELQDHEYYNEIDQELWAIHVRDFMNHPGGFSHISFLEFVSSQKGFRSVDYQFSFLPDEERDFYSSVPSRVLVERLYPYAILKFWLLTINNSDFDWRSESFFKFKDLPLTSGYNAYQPYRYFSLSRVPAWLKITIDLYFKKISSILDFFTFYKFYNFSTPSTTGELANKLFEINQILVKDRRVSFTFYKNLAIFFYRSLSTLKKLNVSISRDESYYFTYLALLRQIEEIFFNLTQKQSNYAANSLVFRFIGLCLRVLRLKIDGFRQIVI